MEEHIRSTLSQAGQRISILASDKGGRMRQLTNREIELDDGSRIITLDEPEPPGNAPDLRYSNNVFRLDSAGNTIWQIDAGEGRPRTRSLRRALDRNK